MLDVFRTRVTAITTDGDATMALRRTWTVVLFLLGVSYAASVLADGVVGEFFAGIGRDTKRRNCWPQPFVAADRQTVREPFAICVANAWQRQNLLSDHHFEADGIQLNEAGRRKIQSILTDAPAQYQAVFVRRAHSPQETVARIQMAQQFVAQSPYPGHPVPVLESTMSDDGSPADRIDAIGRKCQASIPDPKLPPRDQAPSGGSGK